MHAGYADQTNRNKRSINFYLW